MLTSALCYNYYMFFLLFLLVFLSPSFTWFSASQVFAEDPGRAGFYPLRYYPCTEIAPRDFHPLRPYPASPCDPLIPQKNPEAPLVPSREYLTFSCNNSINFTGTYRVLDFVPDNLSSYPGNCTANLEDSGGATRAYQNYYDCGGGEVCLVHEVVYDFNIDLSPSRLPIIGNTEFPTGDTVLVNSYLDWYLNGTVFHSEHRALNPDNLFDQRRITTYSGPLLKQLPYDIQQEIKETIKDSPPVNQDIHNYNVSLLPFQRVNLSTAGQSLYKYIPFTTQEDTTSEVTVGLFPNNQPPSNGEIIINCTTTRPFEIALGDSERGGRSDSRLYFPHMRSDATLSELLQSISHYLPPTPTPSPPPFSTQDVDRLGRRITQHQGDDGTQVQRYDYLTQSNDTRNTEVNGRSAFFPDRYRAPDPITTPMPDYLCEQPIALTNYGDKLLGKDFNSSLVYYQRFEYEPQYRGTISGCQIERGGLSDGRSVLRFQCRL